MNKDIYKFGALLMGATLIGVGCQANTDDTTLTTSETQVQVARDSQAVQTTTVDSSDSTDVVLATHSTTHSSSGDAEYDESSVEEITLSGSSASSSSAAVQIDSNSITITAGGTYRLSGEYTGGIVVESEDSEVVQLILDNATITNDSGSAIYISQAEKAVLIVPSGSSSAISDGETYTDTAEDAPSAAIDSNDDLTIAGSGTLTVVGQHEDGIATSDGLIITDTTVVVDAADEGIRGKDYIAIDAADITIISGGDGMQSDNDSDSGTGFIVLQDTTLTIDAQGDGVSAYMDIAIEESNINISAGGGSQQTIAADASAKGIKAGALVAVYSGTITIDSADDGIHSNGDVTVDGGTLTIETGDDGIHADAGVQIADGSITVTDSYEGIEGATIEISGGTIDVTASDDGLNVAGGADSSGMQGGPGRGGAAEGAFTDSGEYYLHISGGQITVDATGDGIDVNGSLEMTGGTVYVYGPSENMNGPLDYDGSFTLSGGTLVAIGSSGMAQAPSSSTQGALLINMDSSYSASDAVTIELNGETLFNLDATRAYQSILVSTQDMSVGDTVTVSINGSVVETVELTDEITTSGTTSGMQGGPGGTQGGSFGGQRPF